jgi:hypothetical protein
LSEKDKELIRQLQTAHLETWIGDFEAAKRSLRDLYDSLIGEENSRLIEVLEPSVKRKQDALKEKVSQNPIANERIVLNPSHKAAHTVVDKWKYTFTVVSEWENLQRIEIRAYNKQGDLPQLYVMLPKTIDCWSIKGFGYDGNNAVDLLWIKADIDNTETHLFLSVDRWGLLSGNVVTAQNSLIDTMGNVHVLLHHLEQALWEH